MKLTHLFSHWKGVRNGLLETMDKFTDEELTYKPYDGARSVGEIMLHIANAEDGWIRYAVKSEVEEWPNHHTLENYPTLEAIKELLDDVHSDTQVYLANLELDDLARKFVSPWGAEFALGFVFWHVIEHEIHHRGELSLILGQLGREGLEV